MRLERVRVLALLAISCSIVFGLGLILAWGDGVRLDRLVLLFLAWGLLLALCGWLGWDIKRRGREQ